LTSVSRDDGLPHASQVAERLQVSASWVYKHKHLLGGIRVGERMWRFPEEKLNDLLASRSEAVGTDARQVPERAPAAREWRLIY
jgi:hypothetical protein